jgi:hypothetical protein
MSYDNKPKANWVREYNFPDQSLRMRVSDKGAVQIQNVLPSGEAKHAFCTTAETLTALMNVAGDIGNVLISPEFQTILDSRGEVKEKAKLQRQVEREANKAMLQLEAAQERLKALGVQVSFKKQA